MGVKKGYFWDREAEEVLRIVRDEYDRALIQVANKIAASESRTMVGKSDVAYADSILMSEILEAQERRSFLEGMEIDYRNGSQMPNIVGLFAYYCERCSRPFKRRDPRVKLCLICREGGVPKRKNKKAGEGNEYRRICEMCGIDFMAAFNRFKCKNCKKIRKPRGSYVYGWYDGEELFYVGMGHGDRAFVCHKNDGMYAPCELRRRKAGKNFRVDIIRDNMTAAGAVLVESVLINFLKPPTNIKPGGKKCTSEDLTLEDEGDFRAA